jgi:hypothetical protein
VKARCVPYSVLRRPDPARGNLRRLFGHKAPDRGCGDAELSVAGDVCAVEHYHREQVRIRLLPFCRREDHLFLSCTHRGAFHTVSVLSFSPTMVNAILNETNVSCLFSACYQTSTHPLYSSGAHNSSSQAPSSSLTTSSLSSPQSTHTTPTAPPPLSRPRAGPDTSHSTSILPGPSPRSMPRSTRRCSRALRTSRRWRSRMGRLLGRRRCTRTTRCMIRR